MTTYDFIYTSNSNPFNCVKFTFDGDFLIIGSDVSDETIKKMNNVEDVAGWTVADL